MSAEYVGGARHKLRRIRTRDERAKRHVINQPFMSDLLAPELPPATPPAYRINCSSYLSINYDINRDSGRYPVLALDSDCGPAFDCEPGLDKVAYDTCPVLNSDPGIACYFTCRYALDSSFSPHLIPPLVPFSIIISSSLDFFICSSSSLDFINNSGTG
ncbi:hypothetical protein EVAR_2302_1 [Eumeta japonica]|uniref:Uncharacterized protein n=1 Tax=Eumeta variegata TaxID=151549 RepID=A0A4C1SG10_EUMVA|nr:hypothetical protein EVAR_2302_1 [Eumeta japonica]